MDCMVRRCSIVALSALIFPRDAFTRSPNALARPYFSLSTALFSSMASLRR
jgi:hypothetical protein